MDCSNESVEPWDWQGDDCCLQRESNFDDLSQSLWTGASQNEDLSYMFDVATPVKACGDFSFHDSRGDMMNREPEEFRVTSSQLKRRRLLQFDTEVSDPPLSSADISSEFLKSKEVVDQIEEVVLTPSPWGSGFPDAACTSGNVGLNHSSNVWLPEYYNNADMHVNADDMNFSGLSDVQLDVTGYCNIPSECEVNMIQEQTNRAPLTVGFKGRKAFMQTPAKAASSIAYPFAFIKPCAVHGDVTLKDINQRIRIPPLRKSKYGNEELSGSYPTSAFSGKPVVGKTKICTDGGKGSITILRTRG